MAAMRGLCQKNGWDLDVRETAAQADQPPFRAVCVVEGHELGTGIALTKTAARRSALANALAAFGTEPSDPFGVRVGAAVLEVYRRTAAKIARPPALRTVVSGIVQVESGRGGSTKG
jgi:hypothetical protein